MPVPWELFQVPDDRVLLGEPAEVLIKMMSVAVLCPLLFLLFTLHSVDPPVFAHSGVPKSPTIDGASGSIGSGVC